MRRLVLLDAVRTDLLGILDHLAETSGSVSLAVDFVSRLRRCCAELATLQVVNILEGHRDMDAHFDERDQPPS